MSASGIGNSTLIGDGSLQYYFVDDLTSPSIVSHNEYWDSSTKQFKCDAGIIQHRTLGVNYASSSTSDSSSHYLYWSLPAYNSAVLTDTNKVYYLYIKAYKTLDEDDDNYQAANFMLSETALGLNSDDDYYYLLTGVLTSETNGNRSYAPKYGMTLIEAGRMIIDRLQGNNFGSGGMLIDLLNNVINMGADGSLIAPSVTFKKADGSEAELSDVVDAVETDITHINDDSTFSINEKLATRIEWEKISGLANVDHNPSEAGVNGSYKKTIAATDGVLAAGTITTEVPIEISVVKEDIPADYNDVVWSKVGATYISPSGIYDDDFSGMKLHFTSNAETTITIDWTVDSEDGYDYLVIGPVDSELFGYDPSGEENSEVFQESGELSGTIQRTIPAGESFIEVRYDKDSSGYSGADQATITLSYPSTVEVETDGPNELVQTLTSKYQALLDLFAYTTGEDDSYEGLALYEDINTPFTRSDLSEALAAYDNAESAVKSAVTSENGAALLKVEGGIQSEWIDTETLTAKQLKTKGENGQVMIDSDQMRVYDEDGEQKLIVDGSTFASHSAAMSTSGTPTVSNITNLPLNHSEEVNVGTDYTTNYSTTLNIGSFSIPTTGLHQVRVPSLYFRFRSYEYSESPNDVDSEYQGQVSAVIRVGSMSQSINFSRPSRNTISIPNDYFESEQESEPFIITTTGGETTTVTVEVSMEAWRIKEEYSGPLSLEIEVRVADGEVSNRLTSESFSNYSRLYSNGFLLMASSQKYFSMINAVGEPLVEARDGDYELPMVYREVSSDGLSGFEKWSDGRLVQWGYKSSSSTAGTIYFDDAAPFLYSSSTPQSISIYAGYLETSYSYPMGIYAWATSGTGFTYRSRGSKGDGSEGKFYWRAYGRWKV